MRWQVKDNDSLKEKVFYTALIEGPDLFVLPRQGYNKKYAIFSTRFGSIDHAFRLIEQGKEEEITLPEGVAHFLEHKLFDEEEGNVFDRFAYYGASPNAFTSFTHTTYLFSCTDFFTENFKLLLDFVQAPYFSEESVAKEQGIIQQEIRMYQDNPEWRVYFDLLKALYARHPVRNDIAGTVESISKITKEILYKCYYTFYHPRNMAIFVTGDLVPEDVFRLVEDNLAGRSFPPFNLVQRLYPQEEAAVHQPEVTLELSVSQPLLNMGFKDTYSHLAGRELLTLELSTELLLEMIFGKSGSLYTALYEEGLIDEHFSFGFTAECSYGHTLLGGRTKNPERLHEKLLTGIGKTKKKGLEAESFDRQKRKMRGQLLRSFNSLEFIANNYLAYHFRQIDFFEILDVLEEITIEDLEKRMHTHLQEDLHAVSIVYPVQQ